MLVELEHLALSIRGRPVLNGVHLHMGAGEIYGLLGPNGAGKSTTISVLTGLRPASAGKVAVLGCDPRSQRKEVHRRIGVLPEQAGCYDWMSGREYLGWFARLYGRQPSAPGLGQQLVRVGLDPSNPRPIGTYSRGMKQRLGLARALVNDPELLILDEPTNGLDPRGRREVHDVLLNLSREHAAGILLCTHLLDDVERLCTRIGVIHHGRTVLEGALSELLAAHQAARRYRLRLLAPPDGIALPFGTKVVARDGEWWHLEIGPRMRPDAIWRAMLDSGWALQEIHSEGGGLENLYLNLTVAEAAA